MKVCAELDGPPNRPFWMLEAHKGPLGMEEQAKSQPQEILKIMASLLVR